MRGLTTKCFALLFLGFLGCDDGGSSQSDADQSRPDGDAADGDADADADSDGDSDGDADADSDADFDDGGWPDADLPALPEVRQVVLLAGQSNMVGLGRRDELPPELASPDTTVVIHAEGQLDASMAGAWRPLGPGFGVFTDRFGPELGFGLDTEDRYPDSSWALIKHSIGATSLHTDWNPASGPLYASFIEHVGRALAELRAEGPAEVVGMLWMQGESDAFVPEAGRYEGRLRTFIDSVRTDLDLPTLPVVIGLIAPIPEWPQHRLVRDAQMAVADSVHQVDYVETADLTRDVPDDPYHYDTEGSRILGVRFAVSLAFLLGDSYGFPGDYSSIQGEDLWVYLERSSSGFSLMTWTGEHWQGGSELCRVARGSMHPGVGTGAELGWVAPASGRAWISGTVSDADTSCGDGVRVGIVADGTPPLWGPHDVDTARARSFHIIRDVAQNDMVSFQTEALASTDCDSTSWSVEIEFDRAD